MNGITYPTEMLIEIDDCDSFTASLQTLLLINNTYKYLPS